MQVRPVLAERWERVNDRTMRFYLKKGVVFHDGTPFNAAAVKFTLDRVLDAKTPARGRSWLGPVTGATVGGRRHRGRAHLRPVRPAAQPPHHGVRGRHRQPRRGAKGGRRLRSRSRGHRPVPVRGVEVEPVDHAGAERQVLGPARPPGPCGVPRDPRGGRAHDRIRPRRPRRAPARGADRARAPEEGPAHAGERHAGPAHHLPGLQHPGAPAGRRAHAARAGPRDRCEGHQQLRGRERHAARAQRDRAHGVRLQGHPAPREVRVRPGASEEAPRRAGLRARARRHPPQGGQAARADVSGPPRGATSRTRRSPRPCSPSSPSSA